MLGIANARLQDLITTWGNIICLQNHNMQKMNLSSSIGEKMQW